MVNDRIADILAIAKYEVDDTGRNTRLSEDFNEAKSHSAGEGRRFEDDGIACDDGGENLPGWNRHWEVPGSDDAADAVWFADRHLELVAHFRWCGLAPH